MMKWEKLVLNVENSMFQKKVFNLTISAYMES